MQNFVTRFVKDESGAIWLLHWSLLVSSLLVQLWVTTSRTNSTTSQQRWTLL